MTQVSEPGDWGHFPTRPLIIYAPQHLKSYFMYLHQYVGSNKNPHFRIVEDIKGNTDEA